MNRQPTDELCEHQRARAAAVALASAALAHPPEVDGLIKLAEYIVHGVIASEQLSATEQSWSAARDDENFERLFGKDSEMHHPSPRIGVPLDSIVSPSVQATADEFVRRLFGNNSSDEPDVSLASSEELRERGFTVVDDAASYAAATLAATVDTDDENAVLGLDGDPHSRHDNAPEWDSGS